MIRKMLLVASCFLGLAHAGNSLAVSSASSLEVKVDALSQKIESLEARVRMLETYHPSRNGRVIQYLCQIAGPSQIFSGDGITKRDATNLARKRCSSRHSLSFCLEAQVTCRDLSPTRH